MKQLLLQTKTKDYPLFVGYRILSESLQILENIMPSSIFLITDENVASLYLQDIKKKLEKYAPVYTKVLKSGETSKSFETYYDCQTYALEKGLDRHSLIVAFGGGVIGDLAGFVAATYMRGIRFIQVPTTLLAHDSAVGGKVAINHPVGKNTIGAFYQPDAVIYDLFYLNSLPEKEWRAGFAELIKHSLIAENSFYDWLKESAPQLQNLRGQVLETGLLKGIKVKAAIVRIDEKEAGIRAHLNFGHTLAHAIEAELGYGTISHGDAVAIGMIFAMKVSEKVLAVTLPTSELEEWFKGLGYPTLPSNISYSALVERMKKDKKSVNGMIRMVLMKKVGVVVVEEVQEDLLLEILHKYGGA
ncbi:3-dehydroquinate synthase [Bacillus salitolerans]|uniref:3-dehydroquinate synthase n=1 Tax=Bacillus salitolerans TaxID=1437434 RepID=A0ABW4LVM6_9BACI